MTTPAKTFLRACGDVKLSVSSLNLSTTRWDTASARTCGKKANTVLPTVLTEQGRQTTQVWGMRTSDLNSDRKFANPPVNIDITISKHDEKQTSLIFSEIFQLCSVNGTDLSSLNSWIVCFSDCWLSKRATGEVAVMSRGVWIALRERC